MTEPAGLLPDPEHPLYRPFWAAAADRRLAMQRCEACSYVRWPPEPVCPECLTPGGRWLELSGRGSLWSVAVYEHPFHPSLRASVPYACALVELDEGPRMIARVVDVDPADVPVGMRVVAVFRALEGGLVVPCFAPEPGGNDVALPD
jgi:uncharacterized OB-fold protein